MEKKIQELEERIRALENKRIAQQDVVPDAIRTRHMGEANRFIRSGTAANKPTTGETTTGGLAVYYDTTNNKIWVYDGGWVGVTLS